MKKNKCILPHDSNIAIQKDLECLQKKNAELMFIAKKISLLQHTLDIDETINQALETFIEFGYDRVRLYSYNEKNNLLEAVKCKGTDLGIFKKIRLKVVKKYLKAYRCVHEKRPVIDTRKRISKHKKLLNKTDISESASLPLISKDEVIGMISLDNKYSKRPIVYEELETLMTIANQIAIALENAKLYTQLRRQLDRLEILYDVAHTTSASLNLENVLNLIVVKIVKLMKIDVCTLLLLDESKEFLLPKSVYKPEASDVIFAPTPLKKSASGYVLRTKKHRYVPLIQDDPLFLDKHVPARLGLITMLSIPLIVDNESLGVLNLYTKDQRIYTDREIGLLMTLANQAAIVIRNSTLYHTIGEDREQLSRVLEITQALTSTVTLDKLLKITLRHIVLFTKADKGIIFLLKDDKLVVSEVIGYDKANMQKDIAITTGITGWVARHGKQLIVDDLTKDKSHVSFGFPAKSEAAIPLISKNKILGVLDIESRYAYNFSKYERALTLLTNLIAIAIENAELYDRIKNFNERLQDEVDHATKELRRKNEELKKLDELKTEFVSNVSHELRTPLTSISGYAKLLYREQIGDVNTDQKEALKIIVDESERLTRLINEVLDLAKLESGKINFKMQDVDLVELGSIVRDMMIISAQDKGLYLRFECPDIIPLVRGNKDLLKQVFLNLLNNALKFTERGGILIRLHHHQNYVDVEITDTGVGIPKEELTHIFKKFHQIDSSLTRKYSGTGLGLSIVRHIIKNHKGLLKIKSVQGKGTSIVFSIPQVE